VFGGQDASSAAAIGGIAKTVRVSVSSAGEQGNWFSGNFVPAISANGRYVAFSSAASNLVPNDTNVADDVFVRDVLTGRTRRVSLSTSGGQANSDNFASAISADGRYVAFASYASNLVAGDSNGAQGLDVFVRDVVAGRTKRISVSSAGAQGDGQSFLAAISADGRYVAFDSEATNLVPGDTNGFQDVFVRDVVTGRTRRVSVGSGGAQGNAASLYPAISGDGRYVAFTALASNLVPGDINGSQDVFVRDVVTGQTRRVSVSSSGDPGDAASFNPAISGDGRYVAFSSAAVNLVRRDTNGSWDVFVRDMLTGRTRRVSLDSNGAQGDAKSLLPTLSADGRYVAFDSAATNLVAADTNFAFDVFVRDVLTGRTRRVSVSRTGTQGNFESLNPAINGDGRYVAFSSEASNLAGRDTNATSNVFRRDLLLR
jgi:Tol biopolymer transport system component